jgi:hypothetical protein
MAGGIEAHNFNSIISLRITTPGKRGSGNNDKSTRKKTIAKSVFSVGDATTTATNKFHDSTNLEDNDEDNFVSSIVTIQSYLESMNIDGFHEAQEEMTNSDKQPSQE